jgi:hypothetical protein
VWCVPPAGTPVYDQPHTWGLHIYGPERDPGDDVYEGLTYARPFWNHRDCACCFTGTPDRLLVRCFEVSPSGSHVADSARVVQWNKDDSLYEGTVYPNGYECRVWIGCTVPGQSGDRFFLGWQFVPAEGGHKYAWPFRGPGEWSCSPPRWVFNLDGAVWVGFSSPYNPASQLNITVTMLPASDSFLYEDGSKIGLEDGSGDLQLEYPPVEANG